MTATSEYIVKLEAVNNAQKEFIDLLKTQVDVKDHIHFLDTLLLGAYRTTMDKRADKINDLSTEVMHLKRRLSIAEAGREAAQRDAKAAQEALEQAHMECDDTQDTVQHWQGLWDREHNAFVQAAAERDQLIRDKDDLREWNKNLRHCCDEQQDIITDLRQKAANFEEAYKMEQNRVAAIKENRAEKVRNINELREEIDHIVDNYGTFIAHTAALHEKLTDVLNDYRTSDPSPLWYEVLSVATEMQEFLEEGE